MEAFSKKLRELREKAGYNKSQLATMIGLTRVHLGRLEAGTSSGPSWKIVQALARVFGVSTEEFRDDATPPAAKPARPAKKKK